MTSTHDQLYQQLSDRFDSRAPDPPDDRSPDRVKREGMDKISFLTIRHFCIFLTYKTTKYNSLYSLNI
jgi:hypothetical protein